MEVEVTVNGEARRIADGWTVADLLRDLSLDRRRLAVEHNRRVLTRADHETLRLAAGDRLEIVSFVGGG